MENVKISWKNLRTWKFQEISIKNLENLVKNLGKQEISGNINFLSVQKYENLAEKLENLEISGNINFLSVQKYENLAENLRIWKFQEILIFLV